MATAVRSALSQFALDVGKGLGDPRQKWISARYFYDELGSSLFEAITLLPEYGLTRADERLLRTHADEIANISGVLSGVAELGSGSGKKTRSILLAAARSSPELIYRPIDVSQSALDACRRETADICVVEPICSDWLHGLEHMDRACSDKPVLLLFLGSSIGNLQRHDVVPFLRALSDALLPGDSLLLGADLVKDEDVMLAAYDDPTGVTAAFNLNLLGRMNRELDANFDLRSFAHEVRWDEAERRIEMHLLSGRDQMVHIGALDADFRFRAGETVWTESSHKFTPEELNRYALESGWMSCEMWIDRAWQFADCLWRRP